MINWLTLALSVVIGMVISWAMYRTLQKQSSRSRYNVENQLAHLESELDYRERLLKDWRNEVEQRLKIEMKQMLDRGFDEMKYEIYKKTYDRLLDDLYFRLQSEIYSRLRDELSDEFQRRELNRYDALYSELHERLNHIQYLSRFSNRLSTRLQNETVTPQDMEQPKPVDKTSDSNL